MGETTRRTFLVTAGIAALAPWSPLAGTALAQDAGANVLRLIVPASPGGGWDRASDPDRGRNRAQR